MILATEYQGIIGFVAVVVIFVLITLIKRRKKKSSSPIKEDVNPPVVSEDPKEVSPPYDIPDVEVDAEHADYDGGVDLKKHYEKMEIERVKEEFKENKEVMKTSEAAHIMVEEKKALLDQRHDEKKEAKEAEKAAKK